MICRRACITGRHVLVLLMSFMRLCVMGGRAVGGHVLQVCAEATI